MSGYGVRFTANFVSQLRIQEVLRDEKSKARKELTLRHTQAVKRCEILTQGGGFSKNRQGHTQFLQKLSRIGRPKESS